MIKYIAFLVSVFCCLSVVAKQPQPGENGAAPAGSPALWMRNPAISPDGKTIAFGYKGHLYTVNASGGTATPLTVSQAHDMMPVWSHDGKYIAFASNRYGNFDVFIMPVTGGTPLRLTNHSANDYPYDFSPDDKQVIFGSARLIQDKNIRFYSPRLFQNLYQVSVTGGRAILISDAGIEDAHYNNDGSRIVFQDRKGYEDPMRKHHTSSVTRDIWFLDVNDKKFTRFTTYNGEDREPVWSNDNNSIFYLNEKSGSLNIYKAPVSSIASETKLTSFTKNPVRNLSVSRNNTLCFTYDGEIYTLNEGGTPTKLTIYVHDDGDMNVEKNMPVTGNVSEFAISPSGREIAFVARGEVFVSSVDGRETKRITNTPQQERMVHWMPDGRSLVYATERGSSWDIYKASIVRKEEPYFYASTLVSEEPIIATDSEEFSPKVSPDGKKIGYFENRNVLKVYDIATKTTRTLIPAGHNYSYADGDLDFNWSPDSKYMIADDENYSLTNGHMALLKADGSEPIIHPIMSGFGESDFKWEMDGKMLTWTSNRDGRRGQALNGSQEVDVYGVFFDQPDFDRFELSADDYALLLEEEAKTKDEKKDDKKEDNDEKRGGKKGGKDRDKKTDDSAAVINAVAARRDSILKNWKENLSSLDSRKVRLTINSASISDYAMSHDGSKVYYLAAFEKGYDLWVTTTRTHETRILAKLAGSASGIEMSKDGKDLYINNNGSLMKIDTNGKESPIAIAGEMTLNTTAERAYIFEHCWRQVKEKFYDPKLHGVDWNYYKTTYEKFLPHINNNFDYQDLLSEMLGELNASHTGGRYYPSAPNGDATASLGLLYDETYRGVGVPVTEVITGGPLNTADSRVKAGCIIEKIDGQTIDDNVDWSEFLNLKAGKNTLLTVYDKKTNTRWDEIVKPITRGEESELMYKRWVEKMTEMTDSLSGGKVGYVHVESMGDGSYREVIDEVLGKNRNKEALIVDTRFNGGGWLHNDLNTFLSGKSYMKFAPQGHLVPISEPVDRWQRPSCVLMSEGNYSDAFMFPYVYKQNEIGKLVGMPVPGTGTAVWWESQIDPSLIFGIPMIASIGKENRPTENLQLEPDVKVPLPYEDFLNGRDDQLQAAVKLMLETINK